MIYLAQVGSFHNVICAIEAAKKNGFNSNNDKIYFLIHRKPLFLKWKHIENILKLRKIKSNEFFFETINERSLNKNLVQRIKKKGDPPKQYSTGDAGSKRVFEVIKHYVTTGGVSTITGEYVPFK